MTSPAPGGRRRIVVIGSTGSGKTSFARRLAARLGVPHTELDSLNWQPGWREAALPEFRGQVARRAAGEAWVIDGNYSKVRDVLWPRAQMLVWLDYPFLTCLWRLLSRTTRRVLCGGELWNGNRETFVGAFLSRDSLLPWLVRSHWRRKPQILAALRREEYAHLELVRLRSVREGEGWLADVADQ